MSKLEKEDLMQKLYDWKRLYGEEDALLMYDATYDGQYILVPDTRLQRLPKEAPSGLVIKSSYDLETDIQWYKVFLPDELQFVDEL